MTSTQTPPVSDSIPSGVSSPKSKGRILLVHRFYHPDVTSYSKMLRVVGKHLADEGYTVSVFTTQPSYNAVYRGDPLPTVSDEDGMQVHRINLPGGGSSIGRFLGGLLFGFLLILHVLRRRGSYQAISVSTVPPVFMGLAGLIASRMASAKLVYHCMDLYPEIAVASGLAKNRFLVWLAKTVDSLVVRKADRVVVLSRDMVNTLAERGCGTDNISIIQNFIFEEPPSQKPEDKNDKFTILFAGNLGRFQGLQTLLRAFLNAVAQNATGQHLELVFMGAGVARAELEAIAAASPTGNKHVRFVDHQSVANAMTAMSRSSLAVVSLSPKIINSAYPSKTMMYLAMGCRLLVIVEPQSELGELVEHRDLGVVVPPSDQRNLTESILRELQRGRKVHDQVVAKEVADELFGTKSQLSAWSDMYATLLPKVCVN